MFKTFNNQEYYRMVIEIKDKWYQGRRSIQIMIKHGEPI